MTGAELKSLRLDLALTQQKMADALGISRRRLIYYESSEWDIPLTIELACEGLRSKEDGKLSVHRPNKPVEVGFTKEDKK